MNLPQNLFDGNVSVQTFLCQPDKEIIGEILPYDFNATFKFNTYSEISFTIDRYYNDLFEGSTKINPYYDLIESLRVIYLSGIGHFIIQDVDEDISENESKSITCFSLEYSTGQKYLENFYVNTGEEGSIETMYNAKLHGIDYNPNEDPYSVVNVELDKFDPYQRYYIKEYKDKNSWNAVEKQVLDDNHFKTFIGENSETTLYVRNYERVRFYWPIKPELSLLHNVFDRIPEWKIGHVDKELWYQERTFNEDRTAVYDFLYNTAADTLSFVMVWDSINGVCNFYKTEEDGVTTDTYIRTNTYNQGFVYYSDINGTIAEPQPTTESEVLNGVFYINIGQDIETQWDTDVFISRENLASKLDIKYSTDDIKTKLKITGSDDLDVRDVNLGQNYILNLSYYNTPLWLGEDLHLKYNAYTNDLAKYTSQYKEFISDWSAAYNEYSDLMNHVPVEPRVMLIGDVFEKLYCVYNKYKPATTEFKSELTYYKYDTETLTYYTASPQPTNDQDLKNGQYYVIQNLSIEDGIDPVQYLVERLQTKLELYNVDQEDDGTRSPMAKTDDVLLTLENDASDSVTIRVRYASSDTSDKPDKSAYRVFRTLTMASTGISNTIEYSLYDWVNGELTAEKFGLENENIMHPFKIKSIGTLGAYFCLVRDETEKENIEDYGIRLLQEKQDTYTKLFITQTEGYMNEEGSQCITSNEIPTGNEYPDGTKWLDTEHTKSDGSLIMKIRENGEWVDYTPDDHDYKNYARFYENFTKLGNVQSVLAEKHLIADYLLNGISISAMHLTGDNVNLNNLLRAAIMHFIILDNDCYVTRLGEELPNGDIEEGTVWFFINDTTLTTTIKKYTNGAWVVYTPEINITLTSYDEYFNYITFNIGFTPTSDLYKDGVIYYSDTDGTIADPQPSVIQSEINAIAQEYNALVNGNVDYSKRPFISEETMKTYYPEFEGEVATTYSQGHTIGEGDNIYTIDITPILENGTILSQKELDDYTLNLLVNNGIDGVLASDKSKLIIHIQKGDYDKEYWDALYEQLDEIKNKHWELVKSFREKVYYTAEEYAAYVMNGKPYVSYAHSQGLCLAKMNVIKEASDMNNYFNEQELIRLSPFIREDEYSDDNFLLTGYESEEEQMNIKQELLNAGEEELKKICQPKLSFDATMANILAIPEFEPIKNQFRLGNFVRVGIRDGYVKRARLLEVQMNLDDPSDFSATFGDLISTRSEVDKHAELLQQAVTAGKSVASNASKWQRGADKATALDQAINDGLRNAALSVGAADGQAITWDKYGIRGRKLVDGTTDQYEPQQFALINNKLVFTDDNWATSRAVVGEFEISLPNSDGTMVAQNMYGLLADAIVGGYIQGTEIQGGSLRIGDGSNNYFQVNEKGDVEIVQAGKEKYASTDALTAIDSAYKYNVQIAHTGKAVFSSKSDTATLTAKIYRRGVDATDVFKSAGVVVYWEKNPSEANWVPSYVAQNNSYSIILDSTDIENSVQISCYIDPTEDQIKTIESKYTD